MAALAQEPLISDGAKILEQFETTVDEQLALQNLQQMPYQAGTPQYDINLTRHEMRTRSHADVAFEKSLLIRQRLLKYK